jgi:hypothetical protein
MTMRNSYRGTGTAALALGAVLMSVTAIADQVIPDDLIVQGSTCVGLDCVNNESFGFDTLILKENNTRLLFLDTSTLPGFPTNDWRLIANDSASGGANFFAIQDATASRQVFQVNAGAAANSIFVSSSSKVGLRTAAPALDLHINTGDTPAHRLEQNNSGGFAAQIWDIAGNEANFFVRDLTGGSRLPFRIRPGAPTSSLDIAASGNVGIGTASPATKFHVQASDGVVVRQIIENTGAGQTSLSLKRSGATPSEWVLFTPPGSTDLSLFDGLAGGGISTTFQHGGNVGIGTNAPAAQLHTTGSVRFAGVAGCGGGIQSDVNGTLSCIISSRQFKNIAGDLAPHVALANVMALRPQVGSYKATPDVPEHWLIAEDAAAVDAALVGHNDGKPYVVKTQNVVADLIAVVQQQQRRIEALEQRLAQKGAK